MFRWTNFLSERNFIPLATCWQNDNRQLASGLKHEIWVFTICINFIKTIYVVRCVVKYDFMSYSRNSVMISFYRRGDTQMKKKMQFIWYTLITGFFSVAKPYNCTTLGWLLNWPMMAASCRKRTSSSMEASSCSSRAATSFSPVEECQSPLCTIPNVSERRYDRILCRNNTTHWYLHHEI